MVASLFVLENVCSGFWWTWRTESPVTGVLVCCCADAMADIVDFEVLAARRWRWQNDSGDGVKRSVARAQLAATWLLLGASRKTEKVRQGAVWSVGGTIKLQHTALPRHFCWIEIEIWECKVKKAISFTQFFLFFFYCCLKLMSVRCRVLSTAWTELGLGKGRGGGLKLNMMENIWQEYNEHEQYCTWRGLLFWPGSEWAYWVIFIVQIYSCRYWTHGHG